jgi:cytosine/adenosine deaminase-related metal-dependent hydrolase
VDPARPLLITADALADAQGQIEGEPVGLLLSAARPRRTVLARGGLDGLGPIPPSTQRLDLPGCLLLPGLVNAHTHLDLTVIGPRPVDRAMPFAAWLADIRDRRPTEPEAIAASVALGVRCCRDGGVVAVGDIAGAVRGAPSWPAVHALQDSELLGVSFLEFFAIGAGQARRLEQLQAGLAEHSAHTADVALGLQPHAPYSVGPAGYETAADLARTLGLPLMTHAAESPDERELIAHARGPQRELLASLGLWTDDLLSVFGQGLSPVEHLYRAVGHAPLAVVHVNDADETDLALIAQAGWSVVYCPRASDAFAAPARFGPHQYRRMLELGIPVALGTDSIVSLPAGTDRLSTFDEMRHLFRRDGTDPLVLLAMATTNGARALGMDPSGFTLGVGAQPAGITAVEVLGTSPPAPVSTGNGHGALAKSLASNGGIRLVRV